MGFLRFLSLHGLKVLLVLKVLVVLYILGNVGGFVRLGEKFGLAEEVAQKAEEGEAEKQKPKGGGGHTAGLRFCCIKTVGLNVVSTA